MGVSHHYTAAVGAAQPDPRIRGSVLTDTDLGMVHNVNTGEEWVIALRST